MVGPPRGEIATMSTPTVIHAIGASLFALAILHTFLSGYFEHLAHTRPALVG